MDSEEVVKLDREAVEACAAALEAKFAGGRDAGALVTGAQLDRLCARATRGIPGSEDFDWLHSDGGVQRVVFVMEREGLEVFLRSPRPIDAMRTLGWEDRWILRKLKLGLVFKIGIFPKHANNAVPATWDGVFRLVQRVWPGVIGDKVVACADGLRTRDFGSIQEEGQRQAPVGYLGGGGTFYDINEAADRGVSEDPRYMSEERFSSEEVAGTLPEVRGFLYNRVSLNPLFDGGGFTKLESGENGVLEFLCKNEPVAHVRHHRFVDIPVVVADVMEEKVGLVGGRSRLLHFAVDASLSDGCGCGEEEATVCGGGEDGSVSAIRVSGSSLASLRTFVERSFDHQGRGGGRFEDAASLSGPGDSWVLAEDADERPSSIACRGLFSSDDQLVGVTCAVCEDDASGLLLHDVFRPDAAADPKMFRVVKLARHAAWFATVIRRRIHRDCPEVRWEEQTTIELIRQQLTEIRTLGRHGRAVSMSPVCERRGGIWVDVCARDERAESLPTILLRADCDALPVSEATGLQFASRTQGTMHACGHDMHVAMLLAALRAIVLWDAPLVCNLRCVFQRAEENPITMSGGECLCKHDGVLDGVDAVYGLHVWAKSPAGHFFSNASAFMGNSDRLKVSVSCCGGHASAPHRAVNAIDVAVDVCHALRGFDTRTLGPMEPSALVPTIVQSGSATNVIPSRAEVWFGVRNFLPHEQRVAFHEQLAEKVSAVSRGYFAEEDGNDLGASGVKTEAILGHPATINNAEHVAVVCRALAQHADAVTATGHQQGDKRGLRVDGNARAVLGGEDFSHYLNCRPGAFFFLGGETPGTGDHHAPTFNPDESVLWRGVLFWLAIASSEEIRDTLRRR